MLLIRIYILIIYIYVCVCNIYYETCGLIKSNSPSSEVAAKGYQVQLLVQTCGITFGQVIFVIFGF